MERQKLIEDLASRIEAVIRPHPVRVAIDGVDAAGKTTLADELAGIITALGRPVVRASIQERYVPGLRLYLASARPEHWASVVINNNDPTEPAFEHAV